MRVALLSVCILSLLLPACGGSSSDPAPEFFIQGTFTIDDGSPISFMEKCDETMSEIGGEEHQGIGATDLNRPLGINMGWPRPFISAPGTFDADGGMDELNTYIIRNHPTDPSKVRMSSVGEGTIIFEQLGYASGDLISGRIEGVVMTRDDPDDTIRITFDQGSFHCQVH